MINQDSFHHKHLLAIDYGEKFTGLANYKVGIDPFILKMGRIPFKSQQQLIADIQKVIEGEFIDIVILGMPYLTDGTESTRTKIVKAFLHKLQSSISIPLYEQDESLSTYEAQQRMIASPEYNFQVDMQQIDALSACIILEEFLKNPTQPL